MEEKYRWVEGGWCWERGGRVYWYYSLGWLWLGMAELLVVHGPLILHCTSYRPVLSCRRDVNQQEEEETPRLFTDKIHKRRNSVALRSVACRLMRSIPNIPHTLP